MKTITSQRHRKRILIVEDGRNMRRVLAGLLKREGYDVIEAPNGARALEEVALESVDVVLTDLKMPQMNGLELLEAIRGRGFARYRLQKYAGAIADLRLAATSEPGRLKPVREIVPIPGTGRYWRPPGYRSPASG